MWSLRVFRHQHAPTSFVAHGACTGFKNMGDIEYCAALLGQEVQQVLHGTFVWSKHRKPASRNGLLVERCSKRHLVQVAIQDNETGHL